MERPANYAKLLSTAQAIIDDHIRAGLTPPLFPDYAHPLLGRPIDVDSLPED